MLARARMASKDSGAVPRLVQIETVEGLVDEKRRLWSEEPDRQEAALALPL